MSFGPNTLEEAQTYRYGSWAGQPNGRAYDPRHCAALAADSNWRVPISHQCRRLRQADSIFCKQHEKSRR